MTMPKRGTFFNSLVSLMLLNIFTNTEIYDEFLLTVFSLFCSLVLSIMNLRLLYANHKLLYTSFLPVKKRKE